MIVPESEAVTWSPLIPKILTVLIRKVRNKMAALIEGGNFDGCGHGFESLPDPESRVSRYRRSES
jgi:hypothetical protein